MAPGRGGRSGGAAGGANAPPRPAAARQRRHSHGCAPSAPIGIIRAGGCPKHRRWVAFGAFGGGEGERAGGRPAVCPSYSPPPAPAPASVGCLPPTTRASSPSVSAAYLHRRGHRCCGGSCDSFVLHVWSQRLATRQTGTPNRHIWGGGPSRVGSRSMLLTFGWRRHARPRPTKGSYSPTMRYQALPRAQDGRQSPTVAKCWHVCSGAAFDASQHPYTRSSRIKHRDRLLSIGY